MPKFSISILTYTAIEHARACIGSVLVNSRDFELILTANGNPEAAAFFLELYQQYPDVIRVITNGVNEGFIEPNKKALAIANGEFFVMLNDDATVPPGWLEMLEAPFKQNPRMAITGPVGGCRTLTEEYHGTLGPELDYIEGSCLCGKVSVLRKVGLFAPYIFFAYCEDSDLCLRVREAGYAISEVPFTLQHHRGGTSSKLNPEAAVKLWTQANANRAACLERWAFYLKTRRFVQPIIVRRNAAWGDVLLTTAVIRALKEEQPAREIYVESALCEVFARNPDVTKADQRIEIEGARLINLDMAYEQRPGVHIIAAYANEANVHWPVQLKTVLIPDPKDIEVERSIFERDGRTWIAIHPGPTTWVGKNWPVNRWGELTLALGQRGLSIVIVGAPHEHYDKITCDKDRRGKTSVSRLAAVLSCCKLLIGVDSFPLHVAQSQGTPVVGLFGVTSPEFILTAGSLATGIIGNGPMTGARHKVTGAVCVDSDGAEMLDITPQRVIAGVERLLAAIKEGKTP